MKAKYFKQVTFIAIIIFIISFSSLIVERSFFRKIIPQDVPATSQPKDNNSAVITLSDATKLAINQAPLSTTNDQLRKFPFPYNAMVAISSDIDYATLGEFEEYHLFLNTLEQTPHGPGLGLDIGDSAWLFNGNDSKQSIDKEGHGVESSMTYFEGLDSTRKKDADEIIHYFKTGWIDSLHTFGDFSRADQGIRFTRDMAIAAWEDMNKNGLKPKVWINHGSESNVQNFGAFNPKGLFKYQAGDDPKSKYYHTDLTLDNGIRYVWNSIGMSQFSYEYPLFPLKLRDGRQVWSFYRYTHDVVKGVYQWTWETHELPKQITSERLECLVQEGKYSIIAQHLGKGSEGFPFNPSDIESLKLLKGYQDQGKIMVARTSRLLDYARAQKFVKYSITQIDGKTYINFKSIEDAISNSSNPTIDDIRGITIYVEDPANTYLLLNTNLVSEDQIQRNTSDGSGKKSIGIKWYKEDYTNYTYQKQQQILSN